MRLITFSDVCIKKKKRKNFFKGGVYILKRIFSSSDFFYAPMIEAPR